MWSFINHSSKVQLFVEHKKVIFNIIELHEHVLYYNDMDKPMYGTIPEEYEDVKRVVGGVS